MEWLRVYGKKQRHPDKPIKAHRFPFILLTFHVSFRYLAGRFPETTNAIDVNGRTALHYAATLADNGHYYNLLLHLGANPLTQDNVSRIFFFQITRDKKWSFRTSPVIQIAKKVTGSIESRFKRFSLNLGKYLVPHISCIIWPIAYISFNFAADFNPLCFKC